MRIDHRRALDLNAFCPGVDQEQRQAIAFAGRTRGAGRDDQQIGGVPVDHKGLVTLKLETVA